jgi:RsiW-degrading membrane proteinase PrsW (M82 family)
MTNHVPTDGNTERQSSQSTANPLGSHPALMRKTCIVPILATMAASLALSLLRVNSFLLLWIVGGYIAFLVNYFTYIFCGRDKSLWLIAGIFSAMTILLQHNMPLFFFLSFYKGLFLDDLKGAFLGHGLGEEFVKALPVLALAFTGRMWKNQIAQRASVLGPLDGILIGIAAASAFALTETIEFDAVVTMNGTFKNWLDAGYNLYCHTPNSTKIFIDESCDARAVEFTQLHFAVTNYAALVGILSRGIRSLALHLAWSGIFGYFIGLAVLTPSSAPRIMLTGWLAAAGLHGAWNSISLYKSSMGTFPALIGFIIIVLVSYSFLGSLVLRLGRYRLHEA